MKKVYPITLKKGKKYIVVYIPDFNINSQGIDIADAIEMARDAIGAVGIDMIENGEELPKGSKMKDIVEKYPEEEVTLVDIDFTEYKRQNDMKAVRKNCTIPSWLNWKAEKAGINFSAVLQAALKKELGI